MRAVSYLRISQDRSGERAGVARQQADTSELARRRGWEVVAELVDNDVSAGGQKMRPRFEELLELIDGGGVDVVLAWALDRLTRNRRDTVRLIESAQRHGVLIALVRGSDMDMSTPAGRLTADILASVARNELEQMADRHQRAAEQAAQQGRWHGGVRPFGYEADGMTVREHEAVAIRDAYAWTMEGIGFREIARRWNAAGLRTTRPSRTGDADTCAWTGNAVARVLATPRYAGLRTHRGQVVGPARWPALVDEDTFHAARAITGAPDRRHRSATRRLLSGIATCGVCSAPVEAATINRNLGYRCSATYGHVGRKQDPIDAYVVGLVLERLQQPDALPAFPREDTPALAPLLRQADELQQRRDGLAEAYADGTITLTQLRRGTERVNVQLAGIEQQITAARPAVGRARALISEGDVAARWDGFTLASRRSIIELLLDEVAILPVGRGRGLRFDPDSVRISWHA